jgi:SAM-dependent methyltransferase
MTRAKLSAAEMASYYKRLHKDSLAFDQRDNLRAVIDPTANPWVNRFIDFAHRLGMKKAFRVLEANLGSLSERPVLDLGCGRGRWCRDYALRGARLTGVDVSPDAIDLLIEEMPEHQFLCESISSLNLPRESFDIVNSVTVLQHMPFEQQRIALELICGCLRQDGFLVLLENISAFDAPWVFPHTTEAWIAMAEAAGLHRIDYWGSNFEGLFRAKARLWHSLHPQQKPGVRLPSPTSTPASWARRLTSAVNATVAVLSFPAEWCCHRIPMVTPTHAVMIFRKGRLAA